MDSLSQDLEGLLRRVVREEVRAALADIMPTHVGPLLTYKRAAEQLNHWWRHPWDTRKRLTVRSVREAVERGDLRAVRFGERPPRVPLAELVWYADWFRHTRDERDREYHEQRQMERDYNESLRRKRRESRKSARRSPRNESHKPT